MLKTFLDSFSLSPSEQKVATALVEFPHQRASVIAQHCTMPRNTVRSILDQLTKVGLVTCTRIGNANHYSFCDSAGLRKLLASRKELFELEHSRQLKTLSQVEPLLSSNRRSTKPKVSVYEGYRGLRGVYEDTLSASSIRSWASFDINSETLPAYFQSYYRRRAKRGITMRSIHPDTPLARKHRRRDAQELRVSKLVPSATFNLKPEIQVYDNKVSIVSWKEKVALIIESEEISSALSAIFKLSWKGLR